MPTVYSSSDYSVLSNISVCKWVEMTLIPMN